MIDGSNTAITVMSRTSRGNEISMSTSRINTVSTAPPKNPLIAPTRVPIVMEMPTAMKPIERLMRAPKSTRLNTSRPNRSVPIRCSSDGGRCRVALMSSMALGSKGAR